MMTDLISLTTKLISFESTQANIKARKKILDYALANLKGYKIERFEHDGQPSALIYNSSKRPKKFQVILNGHLDVVPGKKEGYKPIIRNGKLYGVGCLDMKASVACLINAFKNVADKVDYPLALQLVTDEEVGGFDGTKYQVDEGVRADFVLAAEPTNFDIVSEAKGVLWIKVSAAGATAHGAYPWRGQNAVLMMMDFIRKLFERYPIPTTEQWSTTVNLSKIETNNQVMNKIPDECTAFFDIRYIPEDEDKVLDELKKMLPKKFDFEVLVSEPSLITNENNEYVQRLSRASEKALGKSVVFRGANGTSDARHFARVNCPGVEFGPIGGDIGGDGEWVDVKSIKKYQEIIENFLLMS